MNVRGMSARWWLILLVLAQANIGKSESLTVTNLVLSDGSKYRNASLVRVEGNEAVIKFSFGIIRLPIKSLPNAARKTLGLPTDDDFNRQDGVMRQKQELENRKIAAEEKEGNDIRARRQAEIQKLAGVSATIKGGAWLTKRTGNSDVLRGLNIIAFSSVLKPASAQKYLDLELIRK